MAATTTLLATTVSAQGFDVDGFSPTSGSQGTLVTLNGSGLSADPADHWAFVHDPVSGLGAVLSPVSGSPTSWSGSLGFAAGSFAGTPHIWSGERFDLPSSVYSGETGVYLIVQAEWFVPTQRADAPGPFTVTSASPQTVASDPVVTFEIVLNVPLVLKPDGIDLHITIDGGGALDTPPGDGGPSNFVVQKSGSSSSGARALRLLIHNLDPKTASPGAFARDLKAMLLATYGVLGVEVEVLGTEVHISWTGATTLESGFAVLHWEL